MKWFVGVDGGGSKTAVVAAGADGIVAGETRHTGCSYQSLGIDAAVAVVAQGVGACLASVGCAVEDCAGCCVGMPCYGENEEQDTLLSTALTAALRPIPLHIVNDVEVGWAGALEQGEGIHLVAGTGSIAFGKGCDGQIARCGGWVEFFGDEGSCYWIGREAMSLFSKEADGRSPRGPLYELVRQQFALTEDDRFVDVVRQTLAPNREQVAQFQRVARQAAQAGDEAAVALYGRAAQELALLVGALKAKLHFSAETVTITYSGGLFEAGELILQPLRQQVAALGGRLQPPSHSGAEGALQIAIDQYKRRNNLCF